MRPGRFGNKTNWKVIGILIILVVVVVTIWYFITSGKKDSVENETQGKKTVQEDNKLAKRKILIATKNMNAGDFVHIEDFKQVDADPNTTPIPIDAVENTIDLQDKRLKSPIKENETIQSSKLIEKTAWYEPGDRLTEINFVDGAIPSVIPKEQLVGTLVDVKLFKKGSKDMTVASKVAIVAENGNKLGFNLNPTEIEYLKESITELDGLYLVAYLDETQEPSKITYIPSYEYTEGGNVDEQGR